jgi:hypothetical protein
LALVQLLFASDFQRRILAAQFKFKNKASIEKLGIKCVTIWVPFHDGTAVHFVCHLCRCTAMVDQPIERTMRAVDLICAASHKKIVNRVAVSLQRARTSARTPFSGS